MTKKYGVIVYCEASMSKSVQSLHDDFHLVQCKTLNEVTKQAALAENELILVDELPDKDSSFAILDQIKTLPGADIENIAVVLLTEKLSLDQRIMACELGADDCVSPCETHDDLVTRLQSTIFNSIASRQLKEQLKAASDVAMTAMANTSDMGVNIQFLLDSHQCQNFDELGQMLFQSLNHYGLHCSLQIRGKYKTKNMEVSGLEKAMESKLLWELRDAGRFYDFGSRTVVNYNTVSVLIKNMPVSDDEKYGAVKDNIFALLQGADAKVKSLDLQTQVHMEHQAQLNMVQRLEKGLEHMGQQYRELTKQVSAIVYSMSDSIENSMQTLLLSDEQEEVLIERLEEGKNSLCDVFETYSHMDDDIVKIIRESAIGHQSDVTDLGVEEFEELLGMVKRIKG